MVSELPKFYGKVEARVIVLSKKYDPDRRIEKAEDNGIEKARVL